MTLLQGPNDAGIEWPMILIGTISAVLLAAGLIPPYFEIWKRRGRVVGISEHANSHESFRADERQDFVFLMTDSLGAFFSLMALGECSASILVGADFAKSHRILSIFLVA